MPTPSPHERQLALAALATLSKRDLTAIWRKLNLSNPGKLREPLAQILEQVADKYGTAASALAADWYDEARADAGAAGSFTAVPAELPGEARFAALAGWGIGPLFDKDYAEANMLAEEHGVKVEPKPTPHPEAALSLLAGGLQRIVLDQARDTTYGSVGLDPAGPRYARHASANACAFCRMLASRGATYVSEASASRVVGRGAALSTNVGRTKGRKAQGIRTRGSRPLDEKFHDNCVVPGTLVAGPDTQTGYRRHYEGEIVTLVTAAGNQLSVTPKHPVLTDRGWVPAGLLDVGDYVVSARSGERNVVGGPDVNHVPARIEDLVSSLGVMSTTTRRSVPGTPEQFHGDGFTSEVHVVSRHHLLRHEIEVAGPHPVAELNLHRAADQQSIESFLGASLCELHALGLTALSAANSSMGGLGDLGSFGVAESFHPHGGGLGSTATLDPGFTQPAGDDISRDPIAVRDRELALSGLVSTGNIVGTGQSPRRAVAVPRKFDPSTPYGGSEARRVFAELGADLRERLAGSVHLDRLIDKRVSQYHGDVLNLETLEGWYSANSITVSNCHCVAIEVFPGTDYTEASYVKDWRQTYNDVKVTHGPYGAIDTKATLAAMREAMGTH